MSVVGLGTRFKLTTECFHILVNFWFIVTSFVPMQGRFSLALEVGRHGPTSKAREKRPGDEVVIVILLALLSDFPSFAYFKASESCGYSRETKDYWKNGKCAYFNIYLAGFMKTVPSDSRSPHTLN